MLHHKPVTAPVFFLNCPHADKHEPKDHEVFATCKACGKSLRRFKGVHAGK